eukprot:1465287-Pyramimonas_sp.AAC.1
MKRRRPSARRQVTRQAETSKGDERGGEPHCLRPPAAALRPLPMATRALKRAEVPEHFLK